MSDNSEKKQVRLSATPGNHHYLVDKATKQRDKGTENMFEVRYCAIRQDNSYYAGISHIDSDSEEAVAAFRQGLIDGGLKGATIQEVYEIQLPSKVLASYGGIIRKTVDAYLSQLGSV